MRISKWHCVLLLVAVASASCDPGTGSKAPARDRPAPEEVVAKSPPAIPEGQELPPTLPTSHSIYNLDSIWTTKNGKEMPLGGLGGKIQILALGYTTCQFACPRLIHDMRQIETQFSDIDASELGFTFVSIDPETDTPEQLREYVDKHKLAPGKWQLLTGDEESVLDLAVLLGVKYRRTTETDIAHSSIITVLNAKGEIVYQQIGLGTDSSKTISWIKQLLANRESAGPKRAEAAAPFPSSSGG